MEWCTSTPLSRRRWRRVLVTSHSLRQDEDRPDTIPRQRAVIRSLVATARPRQWIKNVLVFAAPATAGVLLQPAALAKATVAFVAFSMASSAMYFLNDVNDRVRDAAHPTKRLRPMAAGDLSRRTAWVTAVVLMATAVLTAAVGAGAPLTGAVVAYLVLVTAYTYWLKDIVLVDVVAVAATFVLRAAAGGLAVGVYLSSWFLLVACFGALFVVTGRRFAEYHALEESRGHHRRTLDDYSEPMLRSMLTSSSTVTITAYCIWAFEGQGSRNVLAALSIIPFLLGIYRYAMLGEAGAGGSPEDVFLRDRFLQITCILWLSCVVAGVYLG
jgi:decaprenyl-phosphate phosphoribosyltransferase